MQRNPFKVLGVSENSTQQEVFEAYSEKKEKYSNQRFMEGDKGKEGAKKLSELEAAYSEAMEILKNRVYVEETGSVFGEVSKLIKEKKLNEAQRILDDMTNRNAEWHYYQAGIYHAKNWLNESKAQLEIAVSMDPNNVKYKETLNKLNLKMSGSGINTNSDPRSGYARNPNDMTSGTGGCTCCDFCMGWLCADACCNCMNGCC